MTTHDALTKCIALTESPCYIKKRNAVMDENRRKKRRRLGDRVLRKTVDTLQILAKISGGREGDFSEYYADLVGAKALVGRRQLDRRLGDILCSSIEAIAANINKLLEQQKALRKVGVTKMRGKKTSPMAVKTSVVGWEAERPCVGKNYRIYKEGGGIFRSARVTEVKPGYFQTKNSLYRIEVLMQG
jgi:hypothetical protein